MPNKAFLEITNACNLSCSFCHGTMRKIEFITEEHFRIAATKLRSFCDYLYFHLMGEPLLHPLIDRFFEIANDLGFKIIITTNGTLLKEKTKALLNAKSLHKISISLHAYEANSLPVSLTDYLDNCFEFCKTASEKGIICVMRLWNINGMDSLNQEILMRMHEYFDGSTPKDWQQIYSGFKIKNKVFLEWGNHFDWPDINGEYLGNSHTCYGLRDQIGVLCDGTVVPCCLDAEGNIPLGNIFEKTIEDILSTERAVALKNSFLTRKIMEPLCQRCGYAYKNRLP